MEAVVERVLARAHRTAIRHLNVHGDFLLEGHAVVADALGVSAFLGILGKKDRHKFERSLRLRQHPLAPTFQPRSQRFSSKVFYRLLSDTSIRRRENAVEHIDAIHQSLADFIHHRSHPFRSAQAVKWGEKKTHRMLRAQMLRAYRDGKVWAKENPQPAELLRALFQ